MKSKFFQVKNISGLLVFLLILQLIGSVFLFSPDKTVLAKPGWLSDWSKRIKIDIDYTNKIGDSVTHFPVTIFLKSGNGETTKVFDEVGANKQKIAITKEDGETQLYAEIEQWDVDNKVAVIHVSKSDWVIDNDTYVYLYYDNTHTDNTDYIGITAGSAPATNVWDSNTVARWEMKDLTTSSIVDSTINGNNGTKKDANEPIETDGIIAKAQSFDGVNDYVDCGGASSLNMEDKNFTFAAWINPSAYDAGWRAIFGAPTGSGGAGLGLHSTGYLRATKVGIADAPISTALIPLNTWSSVAIVFDSYSSTNNLKYYTNGTLISTVTFNVDFGTNAGTRYIGMLRPGGGFFNGLIDEVSIYNRALSVEEIKAAYNSGNDTLLSYGDEEVYKFKITGSAAQTAGSSQIITITAKNDTGNTITSYTGDKNLVFSGANNALDGAQPTCTDKNNADVTFGTAATLAFANGVATSTMKLYKAEIASIDVSGDVYTTTPLAVTVSAAVLDNFLVETPANATSGVAFPVTITSRDNWHNTTTQVTASTTIAVDVGSVNPEALDETEFTDDGVWTDNFTISGIVEQPTVVLSVTNGAATGSETISVLGIPADPSDCSAVYNSYSQLTVSWSDNSSIESGYKIEKKTDEGSGFGSYAEIGSVGSETTQFIDNPANNPSDPPKDDSRYQYRVRAYNSVGDSANYAEDSIIHYTTPAAPTIGTPVADSSTAITWHWTDNSAFEESFRLDFVIGAGIDIDDIPANSTSYQTSGLTPNSQYAVRLQAYRADRGESPASETSTAVYTLANPPADLTLTANSTDQITASWSNNDNPEGTEYFCENITKGTNSDWITATSWTSTNLSPNTGYVFRVKARNGDEVSAVWTSKKSKTTLDMPATSPPSGYMPFMPPVGGFSVLINNGAEYTDGLLVTLKLSGGPNTVKMAISNYADFRDSQQEAYQSTKIWALAEGEGVKTVYVKFYAPWGQPSEVVSDSIIFRKEKSIIEKIPEVIKKVPEIVKELVKPEPKKEEPVLPPIEEIVPKETPLSFQGQWQLLSSEPIREFVLAPLPKEIRVLAEKFPELERTFEKVGITKITDIEKLKTVKLTLPGLTERMGLAATRIEPGKFALPAGMPIVQLSPEIKQQIPSEIVFAKTGGELIDFNIALSVTEKGEPQQKINTISGKPLQLVVKPDQPVKSVKGYLVFKSKTPRPTSFQLPVNSMLASLIFANPVFAQTQEKPVRVEEKLVLLEFEYTDPDGDGIYTAEIQAPIVEGEYEIITVMDFEDPELGKKEIRLITVVDPEGYIYSTLPAGKLRIAGAIVSIYWLNPEIKQYELWPAKEYQQENPQTTDDTGKYSFLVPPATYYLRVEHPNYPVYQSETFVVKEGSGIHMNIELKTKYWWLKMIDWKIIVMVIFGILLLYNFYRDKIREKRIKPKNI